MRPGVDYEIVFADTLARVPAGGELAYTMPDGRVWFVSYGPSDTQEDIAKLIDAAVLGRPEGDK